VIQELDFNLVKEMASQFVTLTDLLGIPRNDRKDDFGQRVLVLGYLLDTHTFEISIPNTKLATILDALTTVLKKSSMTLYELQVITGLLGWAAPAVQLGWVFCRKLWDFEKAFTPYRPQKHLTIPREVVADFQWWHDSISVFNGTHFFDDASRTPFYLFTDACKRGMGGFYYEQGTPN
jgi:hypothetical protein